MPCDSFLDLLPLREEDLESPERERLRQHLEGCAGCQERRRAVVDLEGRLQHPRWGRPLPSIRRRAAFPRWAAALAAGLLLAVSTAIWQGSRPVLPANTRVEVPMAPAAGSREQDAELVLGSSSLVSLKAGSRVKRQASALTLEAGELHAEVPETLVLEAGGAMLTLEGAEASVTVTTSPTVSWMNTAFAAESPEVRVMVWKGRVVVRWAGKEAVLTEGQGAVLKDGILRPADGLSLWRGPGGWTAAEAPSRLRDEARTLLASPPSGDYIVEALVRKRDPAAELGLRLGTDEEVYEIAAGSAFRAPQGTWVRLRVDYRQGWWRAGLGGAEFVACSAGALGQRGQKANGPAPALRAWGGDIEISQIRWRKAP